MRRAAVMAFFLALAPLLAQQEPSRQGSVREQAVVERVVVDAYVTDSRGDPIPDLTASDFRVRVDGKPVALESAEWISAEAPDAIDPSATPAAIVPSAELAWDWEVEPPPPSLGKPRKTEFAPGRLLIFFFQADSEPSRLHGLVRMSLEARRFLDTLLPTDRVAVLSFDSHLKLRQDFTSDRIQLETAIGKSILTGRLPELLPVGFPSLARNFDFPAAKKAVTPEKALALIARAAKPIPGAKSMLYFGWGLGVLGGIGGPNPRDRRDYQEAMPALAAARISIFTLDVTDADYHTLEVSLQHVSDLTGGSYHKTHIFPVAAIDRVRRAIAGHYVLVFVKPAGKRGVHSVDVKLAERKGRVHARGYYEG
jgi:VWFA-related protein